MHPIRSRSRLFIRAHQILLIVATLSLSWMMMMAIHELGHVAHAWVSGGKVTCVVLHPLRISRTDVLPNPAPIFVAVGGVIWGSALPLGIWVVFRKSNLSLLLQFFSGFCLTANGVYLLGDSLAQGGDVRELVRHGVPVWPVLLCGTALAVCGLVVWHRMGRLFGLTGISDAGLVQAAWLVSIGLTIVVACQLLAANQ